MNRCVAWTIALSPKHPPNGPPPASSGPPAISTPHCPVLPPRRYGRELPPLRPPVHPGISAPCLPFIGTRLAITVRRRMASVGEGIKGPQPSKVRRTLPDEDQLPARRRFARTFDSAMWFRGRPRHSSSLALTHPSTLRLCLRSVGPSRTAHRLPHSGNCIPKQAANLKLGFTLAKSSHLACDFDHSSS